MTMPASAWIEWAVAGAFADRMVRVGPVQRLADELLARHGKHHDDVLGARA